MDINDWRGVGTILCMIAFLGIVWWAFGPSRKKRFEEASQIPFEDDDAGTQEQREENKGE